MSRITIPLPREGAVDARPGSPVRLHPFYGTVLSVDGEIDGMSRVEVERAVRQKGGRVVRGVNFMTNWFIEGRHAEAAPSGPPRDAPLSPAHGTSHPHDRSKAGGPAPHAHAHAAAGRGRAREDASAAPRTRRAKAEDLNKEGRRIRILDQKEFLALLRS